MSPPGSRLLPSGVITFLLSDIVGSTRLWEKHSDLMPGVLARHDALILEAVEAYHGVLLKSKGEGDSTFSIFEHAVDGGAAAIAAQQALREFGWPEDCFITARMALHTGAAVEREGDYFGRTVNRVARVRGIADGGEILVSQSTAELIAQSLPGGAELIELGVEHLRDLDLPETVYLLTDLPFDPERRRTRTSAPRRGLPLPSKLRAAGASPMVGRKREMKALDDSWAGVVEGARGFVLVEGDAGIGKSRLVSELASRVHESGTTVVTGRCDESGGSPYQPFAEAIRFVGERMDLSVLSSRLDPLARLVPDLVAAAPSAGGDESVEREMLFSAVAEWLEALSKESPVLLVLEDLHWATPATVDLLRSLLVGEGAARVLVVGTRRPATAGLDPLHGLMSSAHDFAVRVAHLRLDGLDAAETRQLLAGAEMAVGDDASAEVHDLTSGNPLFALAVAASRGELGAEVDLPDSVVNLLENQVRALDDESLAFLRAAAILGTTFEVDLAAELSGASFEVVELALDAGERHRVVREQSAGVLYLYEFNHALVASALVDGLTSVRRRRLHADATGVVQSAALVSGDRSTRAARHASEAGSALAPAAAVDAFRGAARTAREQMAPQEALAWLERAKAIADATGEASAAIDVDIEFGSALHALDRSDAQGFLADVIDRALAQGDVERAVGALMASDTGGFAEYLKVDRRRVGQIEAVLALCPTGDSPARARALASLASEVTYDDPQSRRFALSDEAYAMAGRLGDPELLERVFEHRLSLHTGLPFVELRLAETDQMLQLLEARDAPVHRRFIWLGNRAQVHQQLGNIDEGLALVAQMRSIVETGELLPRQRVYFELQQGGWEILFGRLADAETTIRAAFATIKTLASSALGVATSRQMLAVRFWQNRVDTMLPVIATLASTTPMLIAHHAYWLLQDGHVDEAALEWERWDDDQIEPLLTIGGTGESGVIEAAGVCAMFGSAERCQVYYDLLAPYGDHLVSPFAPDQPTHHYLGLLANGMGDVELAESHFESSMVWADRARAPLMSARSQLERARMLFERRRDLEQVVDLARNAHAVGVDCGSEWLVQKSASLLEAAGVQ